MPADTKKNTTAAPASKKAEKEIAETPVVEKKKASAKRPAEEPAAEAPEKKTARKAEKAAVAAPVAAPAPAAASSSSDAAETEAADAKQRRVVTKESVQESFDSLLSEVQSTIDLLTGEGKDKAKVNTLRFARSVARQVKALRSDFNRVAKVKTRTASTRPANSGFMKPVAVSTALAKFTGWDASQVRSRVDVTKYICQYVKDNNLQDPNDRRNIIPDSKLAKLLDYDAKKEKDAEGNSIPLTYYYMQRKLKAHFPAEAAK